MMRTPTIAAELSMAGSQEQNGPEPCGPGPARVTATRGGVYAVTLVQSAAESHRTQRALIPEDTALR